MILSDGTHRRQRYYSNLQWMRLLWTQPRAPPPTPILTERRMFVQLTRDYLGRKAGERLDLADADAQALIAGGTATAATDDPLEPLVQRALEQALAGVGGGVESAVEAAL